MDIYDTFIKELEIATNDIIRFNDNDKYLCAYKFVTNPRLLEDKRVANIFKNQIAIYNYTGDLYGFYILKLAEVKDLSPIEKHEAIELLGNGPHKKVLTLEAHNFKILNQALRINRAKNNDQARSIFNSNITMSNYETYKSKHNITADSKDTYLDYLNLISNLKVKEIVLEKDKVLKKRKEN